MSPSDYKYGGIPKTDNQYDLHNSTEIKNYKSWPAMPCSYTVLPEGLELKQISWWSLAALRNITKVKVVSFLLGLTLTFLIVASYFLTWDRKGILLTPTPFQLWSIAIPTSTLAPEPSPAKNDLDMKLLVKSISSKLEYVPRKVPEERVVIDTDSHLFSVIRRQFLPNVKSPCWHEEFSSKTNVDPYRKNLYSLSSVSFRAVCDSLRTNFHERLYNRDGKQYRLRCLPYFYIIGQPKCGTTDLFNRLLLHPEVRYITMKEPQWWTRKRFGYIRLEDGYQERFPVEDYLDLFDLAAYHIQEGIVGNTSDHRKLQLITGEASASTMWDNRAWSYLHDGREEEAEPPFLVQDFIHLVQPDAKIIIILRDPVERLYSDYLYFKMANKSAEDFHQRVLDSVLLFQSCLSENTLRACVYNTSLSNAMLVRLKLGMYVVYLLDWLTVFHREQILILRLEDYSTNLRLTIQTVFDFLSLGPLSEQEEAALTKRPVYNTRRAADRRVGPMLPATRDLLRDFHQPFNHKLASVLDNKAFLWTDTRRAMSQSNMDKISEGRLGQLRRATKQRHKWMRTQLQREDS